MRRCITLENKIKDALSFIVKSDSKKIKIIVAMGLIAIILIAFSSMFQPKDSKSDIEENEAKIAEYEEKMKILLLPRDPMDDKDIMLEIRGGAGGDEANIFAGDLARMYLKFADKQGWSTQILSKTECEAGGYFNKRRCSIFKIKI